MGPTEMPDPLARFGFLLAVVGFVVGVIGSAITAGLYAAVTGSGLDDYGVQLAGLPGLWIGLAGVPIVASRRLGSGSLRTDYGLALEWPGDVVIGVLAGGATQVLVVVIIAVFRVISPGLEISETSVEVAERTTGAGFVLLVILVAVLAPVIEELFFRGLLQRSLQRYLPTVAAVGVSGVLFGLVHFGGHGLGAVALVLSLSAFGWVVGWLAVRFGRLGPAIVAHVMFNAVAAAQIIADSVRSHS